MRLTRFTVLASSALAIVACGIDAVGLQPIGEEAEGGSPSTSSSSSGASSTDAFAPTDSSAADGDVDSPSDGGADVVLDVVPDAPVLVPPYLILTHAPAPATVNLSTEGTTEWAYWGVNGNTSSIRNAGATNVISSLVSMGSSFGTGQGLGATLTWSNGPPGNENGSHDWYRSANQIDTSGHQRIAAPSGPTKRTFTVIVGGVNLRGRMTAHLADNSVPDKVDNTYGNLTGTITVKYVVEYATIGNSQVELEWAPDVVAAGAQLRFAAGALR